MLTSLRAGKVAAARKGVLGGRTFYTMEKRSTRPKSLAALVLGAVAASLVFASAANAAPDRKKAIWGPVEEEGVSQFPTYADLGVGIYQYGIGWGTVAPTRPADPTDPNDPAYQWPADLDSRNLRGEQVRDEGLGDPDAGASLVERRQQHLPRPLTPRTSPTSRPRRPAATRP